MVAVWPKAEPATNASAAALTRRFIFLLLNKRTKKWFATHTGVLTERSAQVTATALERNVKWA
jgi:hypothetical protein